MTDKENVVFWRHLDIPNDPVFWGMVRDFNNINPDLHVEMVEVPWNREHEMLVEAAESGNPPDCSDVPEYWLGEFVAKDMLEPLDPFIADWAAAEDFVDGYWGEMGGAPDSPHFVVGGGRGVDILYYRTDIFDSLGLTPPTTLDEFLDAALALTHAPERYGFGMRGSRVGHRFWGDLTRAHGLQFNDDEGNITLNTPEAIEANQWFIDLYSRHRVTPPSAITDSFGEHVEQIAAGKIAMVAHTIHLQAILREELGDKIGAVPMPSGPGGSWTTFYPQNHAIYKGASNKEGAWRFISWLAEAPQVERWCKNPRRPMLPNVKSLMNDSFYRSDPIFEVSINSLPNRGADPWLHPGFGEFVESAWPTTMQRALRGDISSQEMMESLQAHFDAALTATTSL